MIKKVAKLIFAVWQSRQAGYGYGKPWKLKKRKGYKHSRYHGYGGYPHYGPHPGHPSHYRPHGLKGHIIDAVLRRLLKHR
ncbi:hypothetical protein [Microvirga roseola]|uniref:hypothetical protein n=1 Tax=Microvirga roseola TaxID=2883126 RepID=UPI001E51CEFF|nr:hypothetical protein [Microvirga roseola]